MIQNDRHCGKFSAVVSLPEKHSRIFAQFAVKSFLKSLLRASHIVLSICLLAAVSGGCGGTSSSGNSSDSSYTYGAIYKPVDYRFLYVAHDTVEDEYYSYVIRSTGTNASLIAIGSDSPAYAPDASAIVYRNTTRTPTTVRVVNQNHTGIGEHTSSLGDMEAPVFAPDSERIAAWIVGSNALYIYTAKEDTTNPVIKQVATSAANDYGNLEWFPGTSSNKIIYCINAPAPSGLYVYDVTAGTTTQVHENNTPNGSCNYSKGFFNADGTEYYVSYDDTSDKRVLSVKTDGSGVTTLTTNNLIAYDTLLSINPDRDALCYNTGAAPNRDLYTIPTTGGAATTIAATSADETDCVWSADGSTIYFSSSAPGDVDLYSVASDGGAATRIFSRTGEDRPFAVSPDGTMLAFTGPSGGDTDVFVFYLTAGSYINLTADILENLAVAWSPAAY